MTKKLFVSLPMRNHSIEELRPRMNDYLKRVEDRLNEKFSLIDTLWEEPEPEDLKHHTYYLGKSITALSDADLVVFAPEWHKAQGCVIEYEICKLYNIPYYLIKETDDA